MVKAIGYNGLPMEIAPMPGVSLSYPIRGTNLRITQVFANPVKRWDGSYFYHRGLDLGVPEGTDAEACDDGATLTIRDNSNSQESDGYGNFVLLQHWWGRSLVCHLSKVNVVVGQTVKRGQVVGKTGNTGKSTGPHLHWEVRTPQGFQTDPYYYGVMEEEDPLSKLTDEQFDSLLDLINKAPALGDLADARDQLIHIVDNMEDLVFLGDKDLILGLHEAYNDLPNDESREAFRRRMRRHILVMGARGDSLQDRTDAIGKLVKSLTGKDSDYEPDAEGNTPPVAEEPVAEPEPIAAATPAKESKK